MREVVFRYRNYGLWHTVTRMLPTTYAEMSPAQFIAAVRLSKGWITEFQFFIQFFGLTEQLTNRLDEYQLYQLTGSLDFLKNLQPVYSGFFCEKMPNGCQAPTDNLRSMSFQQFMTVDTFFSWYLSTDKEVYLDQFIAALYIHPTESFHPTEGLTPLNLSVRTQQAHEFPFDLRYSVMVNWVLIKSWLSRSYKHLFPQGDEATANVKGDKVKSKPVDWLSVFDAFVGDNVADIEAYKRLPCMDAFRLLNRRIKEAKKK